MGTTALVSTAITPTLFLGPPDDKVWLSDVVPCESAEEALEVILRGEKALLPTNAWNEARTVLRHLGAADDWIDNLFHYARTGEIPPEHGDDVS